MNQDRSPEIEPTVTPDESEIQSSITTKTPSKIAPPLLIAVVGLVIVVSTAFGGFYFGKQQVPTPEPVIMETEQSPEPTTSTTALPTPTSSVLPIPPQDTTENWQTYTNDEYGFQFKYPKDGRLESYDTGYTRIQNYVADNEPGLKRGEYYVEFYLPPRAESCKDSIQKAEVRTQPNGIMYVGLGKIGGDPGGTRFALCAETSNMNLFLQVTENDADGSIANKILSTFEFTQ